MSRWIRGIYNSAANFNLSNALRSASGRILGRDTEHVRKECSQSNEHEQSDQSSKSYKSSQHACSCHGARICNCDNGECADNDGSECVANSSSKNGDQRNTCYPDNNGNNLTASDYIERDYADYTASIRTEGQGAGSWIRLSDESGHIKRTDNTTRTNVEHVTGIPTGVTI